MISCPKHIGLIPLVMISPERFYPDRRREVRRGRKLGDGIISQCDRVYLHRLIRL